MALNYFIPFDLILKSRSNVVYPTLKLQVVLKLDAPALALDLLIQHKLESSSTE